MPKSADAWKILSAIYNLLIVKYNNLNASNELWYFNYSEQIIIELYENFKPEACTGIHYGANKIIFNYGYYKGRTIKLYISPKFFEFVDEKTIVEYFLLHGNKVLSFSSLSYEHE